MSEDGQSSSSSAHPLSPTLSSSSLGSVPSSPNPQPKDKEKEKEKEWEFVEYPPPQTSLFEALPTSIPHRPFWLMNTLALTMSSGGFLTPRIYVPPSLWHQGGCKIAALQTKVASCEALLEGMNKLKEVNIRNTDALSKELDSLCALLDSLQNNLHFHLAFISEIKDESKSPGWGSRIKKLGGALAKGAVRLVPSQRDDGSTYIQLLRAIFEESNFIVPLLEHFNVGGPGSGSGSAPPTSPGTGAIALKIKRVSEFFWHVICNFVIRDFNTLLERYMRKNIKSFIATPK
eukprot:TRINITY_DN5316_c0_g1_i1.p2 TRINITY_DN5316_c0_g1~~TRINITY_DN5316_c0_g1_i1.p2  ORF type:complete len:289 (+),score=62.48 TRINITY_DN5316_c0_g1_i1:154-1020(+)